MNAQRLGAMGFSSSIMEDAAYVIFIKKLVILLRIMASLKKRGKFYYAQYYVGKDSRLTRSIQRPYNG